MRKVLWSALLAQSLLMAQSPERSVSGEESYGPQSAFQSADSPPGEFPTIPTDRPPQRSASGPAASNPAGANQLTPPDYFVRGMQALDENRFADAVEIFSSAAEANPDDINAVFNLALAHSMLGNDAEAIPHYRHTLELAPDLYEAKINLGQTLLRSGDPAGAATVLRSAAEQSPDDFRPTYFLAEALAETGQYVEADAAYQTTLLIDPKMAAAEFGLARSLAAQSRLSEAEDHYRAAAELDPAYQQALLELARMYEQQGQPADAIRQYAEFPDDVAARERIGVLRLQLGQSEEAIADLVAAVAESPTRGNRLALVQAYMDSGQLENAEAQLNRFVQDEPQDFNLRMTLARVLRDQRKFGLAAQAFQAAADIEPESGAAWGELAGMLILAERYPEALAAFDRLEALGAEKPGHLYFRATTHDHLMETEQAVEYYEKFLAVSHDEAPDQEFLARQRIRILTN